MRVAYTSVYSYSNREIKSFKKKRELMTTETNQQTQETGITVFMLVKTSTEWLGMTVAERFAALGRLVEPILRKYRDRLTLRFFDTEFYSARVTDIWLWEATDRHAYELVVEELRETPF